MQLNYIFKIPAVTVFCLLLLFVSCSTSKFIYDQDSINRQRELQKNRSENIVGSTFLTIGSIAFAAVTGIYVGYAPNLKQLKRIAVTNSSSDTLMVNMLSDVIWKNDQYCDFKNIHIPPGETCRLLIPRGSVYNMYFSASPDPGDDELIEFKSSERRKIVLYPGMTIPNEKADSIIIN